MSVSGLSDTSRRCAPILLLLAAVATAAAGALLQGEAAQPPATAGQAQYTAEVDMVYLAVTVTDAMGRYARDLQSHHFRVFEDGAPQVLSYFASERVPVSLGLALDTSGSMVGQKMADARDALSRFASLLLGPDDELFLYRFTETPELVQGWTRDRSLIVSQMQALRPSGGTALYDTVAEAVSLAATGHHHKRAIVVISDGNDTHSRILVDDLRRRIRETDVMVYAIGIDGDEGPAYLPPHDTGNPYPPGGGRPFPPVVIGPGRSFPRTGGRQTPRREPDLPGSTRPLAGARSAPRDDRVNTAALKSLTDSSGGRTVVVRSAADLGPATTSIARELNRQYFLAYRITSARTGQWHTLRVEVTSPGYTARTRRGFRF